MKTDSFMEPVILSSGQLLAAGRGSPQPSLPLAIQLWPWGQVPLVLCSEFQARPLSLVS